MVEKFNLSTLFRPEIIYNYLPNIIHVGKVDSFFLTQIILLQLHDGNAGDKHSIYMKTASLIYNYTL